MSNNDRIVPYDLDGTGKLNYLICYRPGGGAFYIFKNTNGVFTTVFKSSTGIISAGSGNTYDLSDSKDVIVPIDYYSTGKAKQLICYRPGNKIFWIYNNTAPAGSTPTFAVVYKSSSGIGTGPNNYDLSNINDKILPYDYDRSGKLDHFICYRPGSKIIWCFDRSLSVISRSSNGISGTSVDVNGPSFTFNLDQVQDKLTTLDFDNHNNDNRATSIIAYRPGVTYQNFAVFSALQNAEYNSYPHGVGRSSENYDLSDINDKIVPYDYEGNGKLDYIICYRPGKGFLYIYQHVLLHPYYLGEFYKIY